MAKPVLVFTFRNGIPDEADKNHIHEMIKRKGIEQDYHVFVIFEERVQGSTLGSTIELLEKGKHHKTLRKKWKQSTL